MPGKTKIVGIWNWLFTDAGAMVIVKYEVILESLHFPVPIPALDGTTVPRAVVRSLWAQK